MDTNPLHSDKRAFETSTSEDNGTVVETNDESGISSQEAEPLTAEKSEVRESVSDLKERDATVVKLTTKDLEDLEKIQEELDSLTSYLPNSLEESNSTAIHMKSDGLIDDQDHIIAKLESGVSVETQNVNSDSAKVTSMVSDNIPVINNVISLNSNTMTPTIGSTSSASSEEHNISSGICGTKMLKLAPKPVPGTSVVIQTSTTSLDGSVVTTQPIAQTCVVSGLSSSCNKETVSNLQTFQQPHSSTVTPLLGHLTAVKSSDVKVILPQTSNPTQATLVSLPQISTNNSGQAGLKRTPCATVTNQVITKVIITSNPATNQSAVTPLGGHLPATGTGTLITSDNLGHQSTILLASPTKAFTASKPIANTAGTPRIIRSVGNTPPKQGVVVLSRMKSGKMPSPISFVKSPQRIAPAPNTGNNSSVISGSKITIVTASAAVSTPTLSTSIAKPVTIPSSPTKVILKPVVQTMKPSPGIVSNQSTTAVSNIETSLKQMLPVTGNTVQQIQVPGSKFHYVRLVTAPASQNSSTQGAKHATLIPVTRPTSTSSQDSQSVSSVSVSSGTAVRLTLPITPILSPQTQVSSKSVSTPQRMLIPASNVSSVSQVRTSNSIPAMTLRQLPTGTLLQAGSGILMLPAQYNLTQLQQPSQSQSNTIAPTPMVIQSVQPQNILPSPTPGSSSSSTVQQANFVPVAPATASQIFEQNSSQNLLSPLPRHHCNGRSAEVGESRIRKACNCTKSQCLKLYCDCFANGEFCHYCNCNNCFNNLKHEEERQKAIKACLDRNPLAFHPKIGKGRDGVHERRHTKGCNCKRSGCLKNYCECYEAKILCTNLCKCIGCKNFEDSSERKTLMHLADAAEVRVQQQTAAKTKISSQIQDLPTRPPIISTTGERLPFAFVTQEVVEATCQCLLAQSEDGEKCKMPVSTLERLVLEEFGRCLMQIIEYANRTKVSNT